MPETQLNVRLLSHTPDPVTAIALAGRLCYSDSDILSLREGVRGRAPQFVEKLASLGHLSPFEHASFTFGIEGVSRALLAQITRHRIASFSVQSQRYVNKEAFAYIVPPAVEANAEAKRLFLEAMEADRQYYIQLAALLERDAYARLTAEGLPSEQAKRAAEKAAFEDARSVLPNACDTRIVMTMNVRSLHNFFSLRCCNRAQWEIRALAGEMLSLCRKASPLLFAHAGPPCLRGGCPEGAMSCGKAAEVRERFAAL